MSGAIERLLGMAERCEILPSPTQQRDSDMRFSSLREARLARDLVALFRKNDREIIYTLNQLLSDSERLRRLEIAGIPKGKEDLIAKNVKLEGDLAQMNKNWDDLRSFMENMLEEK